jgi:hypothetical protein
MFFTFSSMIGLNRPLFHAGPIEDAVLVSWLNSGVNQIEPRKTPAAWPQWP